MSDDNKFEGNINPDTFILSNPGHSISISQLQPSSFVFSGANGPLITIKPDGTIIRGPSFTTNDEASLAFWDILSKMYPIFLQKRES